MKNGKTLYRAVQPIRRTDDQKDPFWQRIGTAFGNPGKDGGPGSITVKLDSLPLGGEVVLFLEEPQGAREDA